VTPEGEKGIACFPGRGVAAAPVPPLMNSARLLGNEGIQPSDGKVCCPREGDDARTEEVAILPPLPRAHSVGAQFFFFLFFSNTFAMTPEQQTIHIVPTRYPADDATKPRWQVDIHHGKSSLCRTITDPFSVDDHIDCQWYLEAHVPQDPFDKGRADRTVTKLNKYARILVRQLDLVLQNAAVVELVIHDSDSMSHDPATTIHRLYWELLENPWAWGFAALKLRVRRFLSTPSGLRLPSSALLSSPTQTVNVLHVVARNRKTTAEQPTDISPFMTLGILIQIRAELERRDLPLKLNITTIRPGTLQALADHLATHPSVYHITHLDLHGAVDGEGHATLMFESPKSTQDHKTTEVAQVLRNVPVPFLVLNACRSGKADMGPLANTAAILNSRGCADNILAMSFNALSVSAEIFLRAFYAEFLLGGATFGCAARRGRDALKANNGRRGRFEQRVSLADWFVPVTYSSVEDSALVASAQLSRHQVQWNPGPIGRDYDVAALEKILLKRRRAFLCGHAWIGKTTFLQYAQRIWEGTSFAHEVLYMDLSSSPCGWTPESLSVALQAQCRGGKEEVGGVAGCTNTDAFLLHVKTEAKVLVIVDGLHTLSASGASDAAAFLRSMVAACVDSEKESMIVLAGRHSPADSVVATKVKAGEVDMGKWIGATFKSRFTMQLEGLSLTDSLELWESTQEGGRQTLNTSVPGTRDKLELLSRRTLGIPGAVRWLGAISQKAEIPLPSLHAHLLDDEPSTYAAFLHTTVPDAAISELSNLLSGLSPEHVAVLLLLGLFWHQGPYDGRWRDAMLEFGPCSQPEIVDAVLDFASTRGYIQLAALDGSRRISFVHPLFTLFCRTTLSALSEAPFNMGSGPQVNYAPGSFSGVSREVGESGPVLSAVRMYAIVTNRSTAATKRDQEFLVWFLENVDYQFAFQLVCPDDATDKPTPFKVQPDASAHHFLNTLACIRICLKNSTQALTPEGAWPLDLLVKIIPRRSPSSVLSGRYQLTHPTVVMSAGTAVEATVFSEHLEKMLARLASDEKYLDSSPHVCNFFIFTALHVGLLRKSHANDSGGERWREFARHARRLCQSASPQTPFHAWAESSIGTLTWDSDGGGMEGLLNLFRKSMKAHEEQLQLPTLPIQDDGLSDSIARGLSQGSQEARVARQKIVATASVIKPLYDDPAAEEFREWMRLIEARQSRENSSESTSLLDSEATISLLSRYSRQPGEAPRSGIRMFMPRAVTSVPSHSSLAQLDSGPGELGAAEAAMNTANWTSSQSTHYSLFQRYTKNGDMRQANEHLRQLILAMSGDPDKSLVVEEFKRYLRLQELFAILLGVTAADTDTTDDVSNVESNLEEMDKLMNEITDEEIKQGFLRGMESVRAAARLEPSQRLDAAAWKEVRDDFQKLNAPLFGHEATKEGRDRSLEISDSAGKMLRGAIDLINQGKISEALASLDELEKLCQKEPVAMFVVAGGQESIDGMRAELQTELRRKLKLEEDEQAARGMGEYLAARERRRRQEILAPVFLALGSWLFSAVMNWLRP
jgi:hypothetical protein